MWLATEVGFFSVVLVNHGAHEGDLVVRARAPGDLERLRKKIPALSPTELTPLSDYRYRAFISHEDAAAGFGALVGSIRYTNFKDQARKATPQHEKLYHRVWSVMASLQPGGPYGHGGAHHRPIPKKERKADTAARKKQRRLPGFSPSLWGGAADCKETLAEPCFSCANAVRRESLGEVRLLACPEQAVRKEKGS